MLTLIIVKDKDILNHNANFAINKVVMRITSSEISNGLAGENIQNSMHENIIRFLQKQTCATICLVDELGNPYCFNCFYAFNSEDGLLYFKSSATSYHVGLLKANPKTSGTILPDKLNVLMVKGVQFEGIVLDEQDPLTEKASQVYHKKHPLALAIKGETWTIRINRIKLTEGAKGFAKKFTWTRED